MAGANGWSPTNYARGVVTSGVVTDSPITNEFPISAGGALNMVLKIVASSVTQVGTITPKLQTAIGDDWIDVKLGSAITANGNSYIRLNIEVAADQAVLPLLAKGRVVLTTTNAGDRITVANVSVLQAL